MSCCDTQIEAQRDADLPITYVPQGAYSFADLTPTMRIWSDSTSALSPLLTITLAPTGNGSVWSHGDENLGLVIKQADLNALPDQDLFYDITLLDQLGIVNAFVGGPFVLNPDGSFSGSRSAQSVSVSLSGQQVPVIIQSGGLGPAMSLQLSELTAAVQTAQTAASDAQLAAQEAVNATAGKLDTDGDNASPSLLTNIGAVGSANNLSDLANKEAATSNLLFLQSGTGAASRSVREKLRDVVSVKDFGAVGDGETNDTAAFELALAYVESLPRGGEIYFPPGIYVADLDLSKTAADFEKVVTISGAGRRATQIWPTGTDAIVLNMAGRNIAVVRDLTIFAGDQYSAQFGILLARTDTSDNCNNNKFLNVEVNGNFSRSCVLSIAAESALWDNCRFSNNSSSNDYNCFTTGTTPGLPSTTVTGAGHTLSTNVNTDVRMVGCEFYSPYSGSRPFIVSRSASYNLVGCAWICPGSEACVTFVEPDSGIVGGAFQCFGNHYEGGGTVFKCDATGTVYLRGITDIGSVIVMDADATYLDYDRTLTANLLVLEYCNLVPGRPLNSGVTGVDLFCDITTNCIIDYTLLGSQGTIHVFAQAATSAIRGSSKRVAGQSGSEIEYAPQNTMPTAGVFPAGAVVQNSAPETGEASGWVAPGNTTADTDPGGMTIATTAGSNVATLNGSYAPVYAGGRYYIGGYGTATVRKRVGNTVYLNANMSATNSTDSLNVQGAVFGTFIPVSHIPKKDTTANRPTLTAKDIGAMFLDTTLDADGKPIWWTGAAWVDATGAVV